MLPYQTSSQDGRAPHIAIVGLGGAGANILHCFSGQTNAGIALSTMALDERVGRNSGVGTFLQLGEESNRGLGSGGDPDVGAAAAEESEAHVREMLKGLDLLVLVTGLGGGTGSGAAPVIARLARESGVFLVVVATLPFSFEGTRRRQQAEKALAQLSISANVLLCFENDHMAELLPPGKGVHDAFAEADQLLAKATAAVPMLATSPGLINLGLDELKQVLRSRNARCIFGSGSARGVDRARRAAERALDSPLATYRQALARAGAVLVHIAGGDSLSLEEIRVAMDVVAARVNPEAEIFFGTAVKPRLGDELRITLLSSVDPEELLATPEEETLAIADVAEPEGSQQASVAPLGNAEESAEEREELEETDAIGMESSEASAPPQEPAAEVGAFPLASGSEEEAEEAEIAETRTVFDTVPPVEPPPEAVETAVSDPEPLPEPEPVLPEEKEPVVPVKKHAASKGGSSTSGAKTRWIQSSFPQEALQISQDGETEPGEPEIAEQAKPELPRGRQYEFDLDAAGGDLHPAELDNEDLDVPPALRSDKWNSMFPEE